MEHNQPGLYLKVGPPLTFLATFRDGKLLKQFHYEMTPQQATELGQTLIKLAAATEACAATMHQEDAKPERVGPVAGLILGVN